MGANMTPTMKKSGSTVLGVRMGLLRMVSCRGCWLSEVLHTYCHAFNRCCLKAVSVVASALHAYCASCPLAWLTWWSSALGLLLIFSGRVLAGYRVAVFDCVCSRHGDGSAWFRNANVVVLVKCEAVVDVADGAAEMRGRTFEVPDLAQPRHIHPRTYFVHSRPVQYTEPIWANPPRRLELCNSLVKHSSHCTQCCRSNSHSV